jgi:hypothetical protein
MMNDAFSGQLRRHLLATANEATSDRQLAEITERVATTPQRRLILPRLPWLPDRVLPFPSPTLRYALIALALVLATVAVIVLGAGSGPSARTAFEGTWMSTDPGDGSSQTLVVGPGPKPAVHFEDALATGGACTDALVKRFTADGTGQISGSHLEASFPNGGGCTSTKVPMVGFYYDYDPGTGRLVDQEGLAWIRLALGSPAPSQNPPSSPVALQTAIPECIDFRNGGTYTAPAGTLSLTVTLPASSDRWWVGRRDSFHLERAACLFGGSPTIDASGIRQVYTDACTWAGTGVSVGTPTEAIAALSAQLGHAPADSSETTVAGFAARRFDISIPADFDASACTDEVVQLWDGVFLGTGETMTVYVFEVDGAPSAVAVTRVDEAMTPAMFAEIDAIIVSLAIKG